MSAKAMESPAHSQSHSASAPHVFTNKVLAVPALHSTILSFGARGPAAQSISPGGSRQNPSKDTCALFFSGAGAESQPPISLCSYIGDEKTEVFDTSLLEISAGPACQVPKANEFPEHFCVS